MVDWWWGRLWQLNFTQVCTFIQRRNFNPEMQSLSRDAILTQRTKSHLVTRFSSRDRVLIQRQDSYLETDFYPATWFLSRDAISIQSRDFHPETICIQRCHFILRRQFLSGDAILSWDAIFIRRRNFYPGMWLWTQGWNLYPKMRFLSFFLFFHFLQPLCSVHTHSGLDSKGCSVPLHPHVRKHAPMKCPKINPDIVNLGS